MRLLLSMVMLILTVGLAYFLATKVLNWPMFLSVVFVVVITFFVMAFLLTNRSIIGR